MEYVLDVSQWDSLLAGHGYELLGQIGSGSFSDVFAVRARATGNVLAVKRMVARRSICADPRVEAEFSCLTRLSTRGSCVIRLEETILLDRLACLVLELASLGDLERHAKEHWPLPEGLVTSVTRQMLSALTHCHRLHIAHRDVQPANVLLLSARCARLADFGLAFNCTDSSGRRLLCEEYLGRESYMAPEVLLQSPYDALQADLWSMGCLCGFMLTGKHPLPAKSSPTSVTDCVGKVPTGKYEPHNTPYCARCACCSVNELQSHTKRGWTNRTYSCESEESCRSENELEESFSLCSVSDCNSDIVPSSHQNYLVERVDKEVGVAACHCRHEDDPVSWASVRGKVNIFKEISTVESAIVHLVSKLCVMKPSERPTAECALDLWKRSL